MSLGENICFFYLMNKRTSICRIPSHPDTPPHNQHHKAFGHRCVVGGRRRARVHAAALQYQSIAKYFRTRSPVSAADIDAWCARELMALLFRAEDASGLIRDHIFLEIFTPPTYKNTQAAIYSRSRNLPKTVGVSAPSSAANFADVDVSPASPPMMSGVLSLVFLYLHSKVSRMAPPTAPRFILPCMPHLNLTPLTPT
jgi:hypothetical protein